MMTDAIIEAKQYVIFMPGTVTDDRPLVGAGKMAQSGRFPVEQ